MMEALRASARRAGLPCAAIEGLRRLSGGASKESWAFDCRGHAGELLPLVLRLEPPDARFAPAGMIAMSVEARVLHAAHDRGIPVPKLMFELEPSCGIGRGYAMMRVDGETVAARILKRPQLAAARAGMARACGEILAAIHAVPAADIPGLPTRNATAALDDIARRYRTLEQPRPIFELALVRLAARLPAPRTSALVHGDFRNGNLVVDATGIRAVLDWEAAHSGDPAEDLAWLCVNSWRFKRPDLPVGGFGRREELMAGYRDGGGREIAAEDLHWWEVFGSLRWGVICAEVGIRFAAGIRSMEGGLIARRSSEAEFDIMTLIAPASGDRHG